ncbi:uncharacterized protein QC761_109630 [Podospora bellae-mahoneyi]|uniref:DUF6603 domain-containing protein n=1 Tax=Podospora bellae-mahoneyi TaxID=2093777 RepID=A0ABR0FWT9_9PEZI|nr:hypothetical protein QC761_109630 [Podospora bellae-mahoneyi]
MHSLDSVPDFLLGFLHRSCLLRHDAGEGIVPVLRILDIFGARLDRCISRTEMLKPQREELPSAVYQGPQARLQVPMPGSGKENSQDGDDATGAFLTAYFDQDSVDALAKILDGIKIRSLGAEYGKSSDGSSFVLKGVLGLGPVDLSLNFTNDNHKPPPRKDDKTTKDKKPAGQEVRISKPDAVTLGDLIGGVMGNDSKELLPPFVNNIQFKRPKSQNQLSVIFEKLLPEQKDEADSAAGKDHAPLPAHFVFSKILNVFGFSFSYTQCRESSVATASSSEKAKPAPKPTKRIVSASLNDIPDIDIPLIGAVPKPVDQILYLWVQDTSETTEPKATDDKNQKATLKSLTYGEVQAINKVRGFKAAPLVFKKTQQGKLEDSTVVLAAGHHFHLIASLPAEASFWKGLRYPCPSTPAPNDDANAKPPGLAPYKKSAGPLSISNIGFGWKGTLKDGALSIVFEASVLVGPIGFALLVFKLEFPIAEMTSLQKLPAPKVTVDSLAASFSKPPLTISGAFMHKVVEGNDMYAVALLIGYNVYLFEAAGFYGEMTDPATDRRFKSAFMFCRVNGPLMPVGWAELSGPVVGLGYNSSIRMPSAAEIPTFHFTAEGGVSVGVECVIDFRIASITVGATLGATLYLEGPPLSGRITVDFWVTTFDVNFGTSPDPAPELSLGEFFQLVLQGGQTQGMPGATGGNTNRRETRSRTTHLLLPIGTRAHRQAGDSPGRSLGGSRSIIRV